MFPNKTKKNDRETNEKECKLLLRTCIEIRGIYIYQFISEMRYKEFASSRVVPWANSSFFLTISSMGPCMLFSSLDLGQNKPVPIICSFEHYTTLIQPKVSSSKYACTSSTTTSSPYTLIVFSPYPNYLTSSSVSREREKSQSK